MTLSQVVGRNENRVTSPGRPECRPIKPNRGDPYIQIIGRVNSSIETVRGESTKIHRIRLLWKGRTSTSNIGTIKDLMKRKIERILEAIEDRSAADEEAKFKDLYNLMKDEEFIHLALHKIKGNKGINTPGPDKMELDGFGIRELEIIKNEIKNGTYEPTPVRRVMIPKPGKKKKRPLGIPSLKDKIVQQMIYEILVCIYEPMFSRVHKDSNYGFRRYKSVKDALKKLETKCKDTRWCIEGDVEGAYDNVNHTRLINILKEKIEDDKLIRLIKNILKSGVMEKGTLHPTEQGTPQGGIVSPLLFNIYLSKLDEYVLSIQEKQKLEDLEEGRIRTVRNVEYDNLTNEIGKRVTWIKRRETKLGDFAEWSLEDQEEAKEKQTQIKELVNKRMGIRSIMEGEGPERLVYVRYADDWVIFSNKSRERAEELKENLTNFLWKRLRLKLSPEKTRITDLREENVNFLGFSMRYAKDPKIIKGTMGRRKRTTGNRLRIGVDDSRILERMKANEFLDSKGNPTSKRSWTVKSDYEIVENYNWLIRGLIAYWSQGVQFYYVIDRYINGLELSCIRTLAHKRRISRMEIRKKYGTNGIITIPSPNEELNKRKIRLIQWREAAEMFRRLQKSRTKVKEPDFKVRVNWRTVMRLKNECQVCGETGELELHHVNKIKNIKADGFKKVMIQLNRKQIVVCKPCHRKIHNGSYDGISLSEIKKTILK
jgi:nicotine oxidoreductase